MSNLWLYVCVCVCVTFKNFLVLKRRRHVFQQLDCCDNSNIKHDGLYFTHFNNVDGKHCMLTQHMHVCNKICHRYTYSIVGDLPDDGHAKAETCSKQTLE
jgi:hypothetical protein